MFKRNSWLSRSLTPKTALPVPVVWSASALAWVLGNAPKVVLDPLKILLAVESCVWVSMPITTS